MKLIAFVTQSPHPDRNYIIVQFNSDKKKQEFQVFLDEPYFARVRKYDEILINLKFRSIVMPDVNGKPTYETQLYTDSYTTEVTDMMRRKYK